MTTTTPNLYRDFDADNTGEPYPTFDRMVHARTTPHGVFRAVVERDDHNNQAPDFHAGYPLVEIDRQRGTARFSMVDYATESQAGDGLTVDVAAALQRVYSGERFYRWRHYDGLDYGAARSVDDALEIVGRWLKVFHGGSLSVEIESSVHQGGPYYVAYDTRAMRESWGRTGDGLETSAPDGGEWQAYIDGEVYDVTIEKACSFDDDGEPDDWDVLEGPIGGYYGDDHAAAAALEMLDWEIEREAGDMLPLED